MITIPRFRPPVSLLESLFFSADAFFGRNDIESAEVFEKIFAEWLGGGEVVFAPSGRGALFLILKSLGYPEGGEVVVPGFTFQAVPAAVRLAGFIPVFADIDISTFEVDPVSVERVVSKRTVAVLATHLFGRSCRTDLLGELCRDRGVDLLEDCAQACGARAPGTGADGTGRGKMTGLAGAASFFTFGVTKNFTTFGGGMAVLEDEAAAAAVRTAVRKMDSVGGLKAGGAGLKAAAMAAATQRLLFSAVPAPVARRTSGGAGTRRSRGKTQSGESGGAILDEGPDLIHTTFEEPPVRPFSPDTFQTLLRRPRAAQARAGIRMLRTIDSANDERRKKGQALYTALEKAGVRDLPAPPPADPKEGDNIYVSFPILRENRYRYANLLRNRGIDTSPGYMSAVSVDPLLGGRPGLCPNAEETSRKIIHLPLYPSLKESDIERIAEAVAGTDEEMEGNR